jgi:hypothetical protein
MNQLRRGPSHGFPCGVRSWIKCMMWSKGWHRAKWWEVSQPRADFVGDRHAWSACCAKRDALLMSEAKYCKRKHNADFVQGHADTLVHTSEGKHGTHIRRGPRGAKRTGGLLSRLPCVEPRVYWSKTARVCWQTLAVSVERDSFSWWGKRTESGFIRRRGTAGWHGKHQIDAMRVVEYGGAQV